MYVTMFMRLKHALRFITVLIAKCTGRWCCGSTPKDKLADARQFLANDIPCHAIEQANEEVQ